MHCTTCGAETPNYHGICDSCDYLADGSPPTPWIESEMTGWPFSLYRDPTGTTYLLDKHGDSFAATHSEDVARFIVAAIANLRMTVANAPKIAATEIRLKELEAERSAAQRELSKAFNPA